MKKTNHHEFYITSKLSANAFPKNIKYSSPKQGDCDNMAYC